MTKNLFRFYISEKYLQHLYFQRRIFSTVTYKKCAVFVFNHILIRIDQLRILLRNVISNYKRGTISGFRFIL